MKKDSGDGIVYAELDLSQKGPASTNLQNPEDKDNTNTVYANIQPQSAQNNLDTADNQRSVGPNSREMIELTSREENDLPLSG